jgi:hypothetical protein
MPKDNSFSDHELTPPSLGQGRLFDTTSALYWGLPSNPRMFYHKRRNHPWTPLRNQVVSFLVWLWWVIDLVRFKYKSVTFQLFYLYLCFIWRIVFACLVVCRWQVQHGMQRQGSWQEKEIYGSKSATVVWWFGSQNHRDGFLGWASKASRLSLSVALQNRWEGIHAGHTSRSGGLLHMEVSQARVFQTSLKTGGGTTAGRARGIITEVASESSRR